MKICVKPGDNRLSNIELTIKININLREGKTKHLQSWRLYNYLKKEEGYIKLKNDLQNILRG